jgi:hypothetical protein
LLAVGTNASNYASITVSNVTGGSGTYVVYEFIKGSTVVQRGPDTVYIESDYAGGSYTVNVYDDNNCVDQLLLDFNSGIHCFE